MSERDELRELQRRAYGRDGVLSPAEARRLRELQDRRERTAADGAVATRSAEPASPIPSRTATHDLESAHDVVAEEVPKPAEPGSGGSNDSAAGSSDVESDSPRGALRRSRRAVLAAAAPLLVLGIGTGWALFVPHADGVSLTAEQREQERVLGEKGDFDPGSMRAVGQDDDALVWYATREDGDLGCIILAVAEASNTECSPPDANAGFALNASVSLPPRPDDDATDYSNVFAYLMFSTTGEPMVSISRWSETNAVIGQFAGAQRDRAGEIIEDIDPVSLSIIGSFQDQPVWVADRFSAEGEIDTCLIVDALGGASECRSSIAAQQEGIAVQATEERGDGEPAAIWMVSLAYTQNQVPFLTITGDAAARDDADGTRAEVGSENGDPNPIGIPEEEGD